MKKLLIATTALVATAGIASAEVTLSGTGKMGIYQSDAMYNGNKDWNFRSGIDISVGLKGESDSGLSFGGSFSMASASTAASGGTGTLWVSGAFGKLTMGGVDSAALATVGNVSGVGLWSDNGHKLGYMGSGHGDQNPGALYQYDNNGMSFAVSMLDGASKSQWSAAAGYTMGDYKFAVGYEEGQNYNLATQSSWYLGGNATFGAATVKARYASHTNANADRSKLVNDGISPLNNEYVAAEADELALSVDYKAGAATVTAYYHQLNSADIPTGSLSGYGIGASYDLGGGASVVGGYGVREIINTSSGVVTETPTASLGLKIAF